MYRIIMLALLIPGQLSGQDIIGIIMDLESRQPVEYATVYINGTSIGTISNEE